LRTLRHWRKEGFVMLQGKSLTVQAVWCAAVFAAALTRPAKIEPVRSMKPRPPLFLHAA
jgi:hypothetical protein